jgi:hypothetical protein
MNRSEYEFLNRIIVTITLISALLFILLNQGGYIQCALLNITGQECKSCGLTRDFLSFLNFNFESPVNSQSLPLFIFCVVQLGYRSYMGFIRLGYRLYKTKSNTAIEKIRMDTKSYRSPLNLKTVITIDAVITVFVTIILVIPFWW